MPAKRTKAKVTFTDEPFWVEANKVKPDPNNANTHSQRSIEAIAQSLLRFGFRKPMVADSKGVVRAGNGTLQAVLWVAAQNTDSPEDEALRRRAQEVGILRANDKGKLVPWVRCELSALDGFEATAFALADNQTAKLSMFDMSKVAAQINVLQAEGVNASALGFDTQALAQIAAAAAASAPDEAPIDADAPSENGSVYTRSIKAPIYEPKGECPPIKDLFSDGVARQLVAEIEQAGLPEEVKSFLLLAAKRHTQFHFANIAEYYCHATPVVQNLMERSGLIIIDFKKAIEYGFAHMTERLGQIADIELEDDDAQ